MQHISHKSLLQNDGGSYSIRNSVEQNTTVSRPVQDNPLQTSRDFRSRRKLAKGGSAFQQQGKLNTDVPIRSRTVVEPFTHASPIRGPGVSQKANTSNGSAGKHHEAADKVTDTGSTSSSNYQDKGVQADLLDLPLWPATGPSVTLQSQRDIGGGRTRFVEVWHPSPAAVHETQHEEPEPEEKHQEEIEVDTAELPPIIGGGYARGVEEWAWRPDGDTDAGRVEASWDRRSPSIDEQW